MEPEVRREIILDNYSNPFHKESKGEDFKTANANNSSCIDNINILHWECIVKCTEKTIILHSWYDKWCYWSKKENRVFV